MKIDSRLFLNFSKKFLEDDRFIRTFSDVCFFYSSPWEIPVSRKRFICASPFNKVSPIR
jgi:hypothetical protein